MLLISTVSENNPNCLNSMFFSSFKLSQMRELYHNFIYMLVTLSHYSDPFGESFSKRIWGIGHSILMFMSRILCLIQPFVLGQEYTYMYNDGLRSSIWGVILL